MANYGAVTYSDMGSPTYYKPIESITTSTGVQELRTTDPYKPIILEDCAADANVSQSAYGPGYRNAIGLQVFSGTREVPAVKKEPTFWVEKISNTNSTSGQYWDNGAGYFSLEKVGGNAPGAALTGYAFHNGGTEDVVGVHGRVQINTSEGRGWALWGYAINYNPIKSPWHGAELNGVNFGAYPDHRGVAQCLRICMADNASSANVMSSGITIGPNTRGGVNNGFLTGIHIERDSIVQSSGGNANNEAILIDGPLEQTVKATIGGIRLGQGRFKYGLHTKDATLADGVVLLMGHNQRLQWGSHGDDTFLTSDQNHIITSGAILNIIPPSLDPGRAIRVNGINILGTQKPAIPNATTDVSSLMNSLNAVLATMREHGLIAT